MSADHTLLATLTSDDLLRLANEYWAMALTASTALADRDGLERVAVGIQSRIVQERQMRTRPHD